MTVKKKISQKSKFFTCYFRNPDFINLFALDLQLERGGALALDDPQGPLKKRKGEILPLTAHPVRKKGNCNAWHEMTLFVI